jgi:hypothetical protein
MRLVVPSAAYPALGIAMCGVRANSAGRNETKGDLMKKWNAIGVAAASAVVLLAGGARAGDRYFSGMAGGGIVWRGTPSCLTESFGRSMNSCSSGNFFYVDYTGINTDATNEIVSAYFYLYNGGNGSGGPACALKSVSEDGGTVSSAGYVGNYNSYTNVSVPTAVDVPLGGFVYATCELNGGDHLSSITLNY